MRVIFAATASVVMNVLIAQVARGPGQCHVRWGRRHAALGQHDGGMQVCRCVLAFGVHARCWLALVHWN